MNTKQLEYVKEQQSLNIITLPSIHLRDTIDDSIIEELDTIYNPNLLGVETEFKSTLADVSLPHDFMNNTTMVQVIRDYGTQVILIYIFLHTKMCEGGYRVEWNALQKDVFSSMLGIYKVTASKFNAVIKALIENKLIYIVKDNNGKEWLTSTYQIFMYERVSAKRVRDRVAKKNQHLEAGYKIKFSTAIPTFDKNVAKIKSAPTVKEPIETKPIEPLTPIPEADLTKENLIADDVDDSNFF